MNGYDVAVLGAGIIGCAVANACAARGGRVVLVDGGRPGGRASGAAAGLLAPCSEADGPGPFLDLARHSLSLWPALSADLAQTAGIDPELALDGLLRLAADADEEAEVRQRVAWQGGLGVEVSWLGAPEVGEVEPAAGHGAVSGAAWYPGEGHVHSPRAVAALAAGAARRGATLRTGCEVVGARRGRLHLADGESLVARSVVLAAGAWSSGLAARLGLAPLPLTPVRGQLVGLRGLARPPRRVLFGGRRGYAVAKRDGLLLIGATEEETGFDASVTAAATEQLLATARRLVPAAAGGRLDQTWAGLRPRTPDRLPLLGLADEVGGVRFVAAAGHYRNGVLLAPATAEGIASIALDGARPAGWEAFDPRRLG